MTASSHDRIPDTMRTSVLSAPGEIAVHHRPTPEPGAGQVLVRVDSVGVCGSDVHYYEHGRVGPFVVTAPLVLGHEAGGRIVSTGPDVDADRVGQRVALEPGVPCRRCDQCKTGRYHLCPDMRFFATPPVDGAFCEYVVLDEDFAHPVPPEISEDAAGLIEPLSVAVWACSKARIGAATRVLISGAGPIGVLTVQVARAFGATEITVVEPSEPRRDAATRFGATSTVDPTEREPTEVVDGVDAFLDCSGAAPAIRAGIPAVRPAGRVVLVGMGADEITLPMVVLQTREVEVTGTFRYANTWPTAIALAASGRVELDALVTGRYRLEDAEQALTANTDPHSIKPVVRPGQRD
ncbi:L-iditol 2-dehydrogenase [Saccharopolyspora lacisalsi]|uniref:L-iditol 2-dehydrogenase n=1 Tax=Halosaccharopolyspora lacisalsi TaxID=1000566 RepID=A0A839DUB9_9PSEU|nr:NAD(P)-dependent alcohol dehydrogenase [Halosaccharopolyspora lacisalsi]MBA8824643.1 L-iditol 2-dehydrogenase [Halosaccharopolyspora lacisalsi]